MSDKRCIRFASLGELSADDLELAVDVWLDDALKAPWASKESMKLAGVLCRYMLDPAGDCLNMKSVEDLYQLNSDAARRSLVLFALYGMVDAYTTERNELRAALRLSRLQMFRVLQIKRELNGTNSCEGIPRADVAWTPVSGPNVAGSNVAAASGAAASVAPEPAPVAGADAETVPAPAAAPAAASVMQVEEMPAAEAELVVAEVLPEDVAAPFATAPSDASQLLPEAASPAGFDSAVSQQTAAIELVAHAIPAPAAPPHDAGPDVASLLDVIARQMRDVRQMRDAGIVEPAGQTDDRVSAVSDFDIGARHGMQEAPEVPTVVSQFREPADASEESHVTARSGWSSEPVVSLIPEDDAAARPSHEPQADGYTKMSRRRGHMVQMHTPRVSEEARHEAAEETPKSSQDALARSLQRLQRRMAV